MQPDITPPRKSLSPSEHDGLAITSFILAFVIPFLGLILGCVSIHSAYRDGREASGLAIASVFIGAIFTIVAIIAVIAIAHSAGTAPPACDTSNPAWPYC
jgi:hypothetical protein